MPIKYDKATAVGMAGILLVFIAIFISIGVFGINMAPSNDLSSMIPLFVVIGVTFVCLIIIGFISACVSSDEISSRKDAMKVSAVSGVVPMSIVIVGIIYLIIYLGVFTALPFAIIGLIIAIVGVICSSIGGAIGYEFASTYLKHSELL
jgi:uncharacterized membrane protein